MGLAGVAVALAVIVLAGVVVLVGLAVLLERTRPSSRSVASVPVHWTGLAALSFAAGTGAVSLEMFACSVAGLPFHVLPIVLPWVAALAALLLWPAARGTAVTILSARPQGSSPPLSAVDACLAILVAGQVAYACVFALAVPIRGWDAWELWFLKARIFYEHRALSMDFPPGVSFEDYPLHLPLVLTWVYVAAGEIHDRWGKVLYVLQFSSLLLAFNALARFMCSRTHALLFTAMLSSLPVLVIQGAGLPEGTQGFGIYEWDQVGYSDLGLALCFLLAGGLLAGGFTTKAPICFYGAALFLGIGAWTKNEGSVFAIFGAVAILLAVRLKVLGARDLMPIAGLMLAFILPWTLYKHHFHVSSAYLSDAQASLRVGQLAHLPLILSALASRFLKSTGPINLLFYLYAAALIANRRRLLTSSALTVDILVAAQLAVYILAFVASPREIRWALSTTMSRLLLHVAPLAMLATAVHSFEWMEAHSRDSRRSSGPGAHLPAGG